MKCVTGRLLPVSFAAIAALLVGLAGSSGALAQFGAPNTDNHEQRNGGSPPPAPHGGNPAPPAAAPGAPYAANPAAPHAGNPAAPRGGNPAAPFGTANAGAGGGTWHGNTAGNWNGGGGGWHGNPGAWHAGNWHQGWHNGRFGWWWAVPGYDWYAYDSPVYPYPAYPDAAPRPQLAYWYYCQYPAGYYPYVQQCAGPWQPVPAQGG